MRPLPEKYHDMWEELMIPESTLQSVADNYKITRERVRQIAGMVMREYFGERVSWKKLKAKFIDCSDNFRCRICGDPITITRAKEQALTCKTCQKLIKRFDFAKVYKCTNCGKDYFPQRVKKYSPETNKDFCSVKCYFQYRSDNFDEMVHRGKYSKIPKVKFICETCGQEFERAPSQPVYKHTYCSTKCFRARGSKK